MRILFISHSNSQAGAPKALYNIVRVLCTTNEVAVVLPSAEGYLADRLSELGVKCYTDVPYALTIYPKVFNPVKIVKRMYSLMVRNRKVRRYIGNVLDEFHPDIVHTNVGPLNIALEECSKRNIPHVWHLREYQDIDFNLSFFPSMDKFRKLIHLQGNYNICITRGIAFYFNARPCDRIIYDGVLPASYKAPVNEREPFFLFVGRLEAAKGLMVLLRAWKRFQSEYPEYTLKVSGKDTGLYSARCRSYARNNHLNVEFLGVYPDVFDLMSRCTAFVVPSRFEGFGFITAEAMWNGALVLGRNTAGTEEQMNLGLQQSGCEVALRFKNSRELADRLKQVADNPDMFSDMKEKGRAVAENNYSIEKNAREIEEYYTFILQQHHRQ